MNDNGHAYLCKYPLHMARAVLGAEAHVAVVLVIGAGPERQSPSDTVVATADDLIRESSFQASDRGAANDGCLTVQSHGPSQTQIERNWKND